MAILGAHITGLAALVLCFGGTPQQSQPVPPVAVPVPSEPPPVYAPPALPSDAQTMSGQAAPKLSHNFLYIYSFLDVRKDEYTPKVLAQFDYQMTTRFEQVAVKSHILHFADSKIGSDEFFATMTNQGNESRPIPVLETVAANLEHENTVGAKYRLIVFPSKYSLIGAWRYYSIRFILMDARSHRRLWTQEYSGKHLVLLSNSENAGARSKKILDWLFTQLKTEGFL